MPNAGRAIKSKEIVRNSNKRIEKVLSPVRKISTSRPDIQNIRYGYSVEYIKYNL